MGHNVTVDDGIMIDGVDVGTLPGLITNEVNLRSTEFATLSADDVTLRTAASTAQTTANNAASAASAAQTTANSAASAASAAQTTANSARTTADLKVSKSGDMMTGALTLPDPGSTTPPVPPGTFNVGSKLRNHETRIGALEGRPTPGPCGNYFAYGAVVPGISGALDSAWPSCNVESTSSAGFGGSMYEYQVNIGPSRPTRPYFIFVTPTHNGCGASAAPWFTPSNYFFQVTLQCPSGDSGFWFVVFMP